MTLTELRTALKASIHDAGNTLSDADLDRALTAAAHAMQLKRPRILTASFTVSMGTTTYSEVPSDLVRVHRVTWGSVCPPRWDLRMYGYSNPQPRPRLYVVGSPTRQFILSPAVTQDQLRIFGTQFDYEYVADHVVSETPGETTIASSDRALLLLRAQAEALKELAMRAVVRPTPTSGRTGSTGDGTRALWQDLMKEWLAA